MTRRVIAIGRLTVTALVGPNRARLLEFDIAPDEFQPEEPARLNRQQVQRLTQALQRWLVETDPRHRTPA